MSLTNFKLGDLITQRREKYDGANVLPIRGVSRDGFIRARQPDADTSLYNVFYRWDFVFNPARMELNSIALNTEFDKAICSSLYEIFYVSRTDLLLPEYLNLYIKRDEFARCCEFLGWGSAREYCRVGNISDINIKLPDLEIQQRLVDVWKGLNDIKQNNDAQAEPLMKLCMSYLKKLREEYPLRPIGKYIIPIDERNTDSLYDETQVRGISITKRLIETKANLDGVGLASYKIIEPCDFAFVTVTSRNGDKISIAINDSMENYIISSSYEVFRVSSNNLLPEYLYLWFLCPEFDRYARYHSWGSARETFNIDDMKRVRIPIPPVSVQRAIVDIYTCAKECNAIAEQADSLCKKAIPALVQKGAHS